MVAVAIILVVLVLIILLLPFLLDLNRFRDQYVPILEQALHRKVAVEDVRLTLFPTLGVQLRNVVIEDDPVVSSKPFLTVPSVQVAIQWRPLLQRRVQVESVLIESPIVQVIRSAKGEFNIATMRKVSTSSSVSNEITVSKEAVSPLLGVLAVKQFSLTGGTLRFEDRTHQPSKTYQIDNLTVNTESVAIGEIALIRVQGMLMPYRTSLNVMGRLGPLQANLDIPQLNIEGIIGKVAVTANGKIIAGKLTGDIQIPKASTDDVPIELGLKKPVGLSHLEAHFVASIFPREPKAASDVLLIDPLHFNLHVGQSTIHVSGKGAPSRFSLIGNAPTFSSEDFPMALPVHQAFSIDQLAFAAEIQGETLHLQSFKAKVFDGTLSAQGVLNRLSPPLTFSTQGAFNNFSAEALMKVLKSSSISIAGLGGLEWQVNGVVLSSTGPEFTGPTHLTIRDGEVLGFDLVKAIEDALKMSGVLGVSTGTTQFTLIDVKAKLEDDGIAIQESLANAPNFSLRSAGKVGLDQSLTLKGTLSVSPAIAEKIVQRFPMAKAVSQEGRLKLPFVVGGTVQDPKFRLDIQMLGNQVQKKIKKRLEKVLEGNDKELEKLLDEGKDLLKHFFRK